MIKFLQENGNRWTTAITVGILFLSISIFWIKASGNTKADAENVIEEPSAELNSNKLANNDVHKSTNVEKHQISSLTKTETDNLAQSETEKVVVPQIITYTVESGDNPWTIAKKFNIDVDTVLGANGLAENDTLEIGQQLKILPFKGVIHKVSAGDNLWTIAQDYGIDISDILEFNMIEDEGESLQIGQEVLLPGAKLKANSSSILDEKLKRKTRSSQIIGKGKLGMPARGKITSRFGSRWGRMHQGIDIAAPTGQNIYAAKGGKVVFSGWRGNYGKLVIIDHGDGLSTYYGHNSRNLVSKGDRVDKGEVIAKVGSTGRSTGPHVHFEVRINGQPVNPLKWTK